MEAILVETEFVLKMRGIELLAIKECLDYCIKNNIVGNKITCENISKGVNELMTVDTTKLKVLD